VKLEAFIMRSKATSRILLEENYLGAMKLSWSQMITSGALYGHVTGFICERYVANKSRWPPKAIASHSKMQQFGGAGHNFWHPKSNLLGVARWGWGRWRETTEMRHLMGSNWDTMSRWVNLDNMI
jgi:hypothetical protein